MDFSLQTTASGSKARAACLKTERNTLLTPVFMPVGTHATVRGMAFESLENMGFPILLGNTYHLLLRPGVEVFQRFGGLHGFMNWKGSLLTDSGGFQIFSLPNAVKLSEKGAEFRSYVDGARIELTPELSMQVQHHLGSDIAMVLDHCVGATVTREKAVAAMERTHRWALRSLEARGDSAQAVFAIVQGALCKKLRRKSADFLTQHPFNGFAIGGLGLGEKRSLREDTVEFTTQHLPQHLPRYLMGVGTPIDILEAVHRGVDMFDCILPTALAQQGVVFTSRGKVDLKRGVHKFADVALDPKCDCVACRRHSRAYLHHLVKARESLAWQLLSLHNLKFYKRLMDAIRENILRGTFLPFYQEKRKELEWVDLDNPITLPKTKRKKTKLQTLGDYRIQKTWSGYYSVSHLPSGETMHSINDPDEESKRLYVEQSRFRERLGGDQKPFTLWDVGLGPGHNAMAAIDCYEKFCLENRELPVREVAIISFERDLDSIRLAVKHKGLFPHLRHAAPESLIEKGEWVSKIGPIHWQLIEGDFLSQLSKSPVPEIIFYDPFSYKTNSELWGVECFKKIYHHCQKSDTELFTYSASTAVRAALLGAGFYVSRGAKSGPKSETTVAMIRPRGEQDQLLSKQWLNRWEVSHAKFPADLDPLAKAPFEQKIRSHPQFHPSL